MLGLALAVAPRAMDRLARKRDEGVKGEKRETPSQCMVAFFSPFTGF